MAVRNFFDLKQVKGTSGDVIRTFRKNFDITQKELSEVTGIAHSNLSAIENDRIEIGFRRAFLIAAAFGIDPALILFPNGYESSFAKELKAVEKAGTKLLAKKKAG
jgi:transcriptional regulator with XRE-family HTH domain